MNYNRLNFYTVFIFLIIFMLGLWLAWHKPFWADEIYSQVYSIERPSYSQILLGQINQGDDPPAVFGAMKEGNTFPLFYLTQKIICDITGHRTSSEWRERLHIIDRASQIILRIGPNVCMSLALAMIFYFFTRFYSSMAGFYAIVLSLSSYLVLAYWVESRPYSLWFLLTTLQSLLFIRLSQQKESAAPVLYWSLGTTHILLSMTILFGIEQIIIVSALLWLLGMRDWKKYVCLTGIPLLISIFYYVQSVHHKFFFDAFPLNLLIVSYSWENFIVLFIYSLYFLFLGRQAKEHLKMFTGRDFFLLAGGMLLAAIFVLVLLKLKEIPHTGYPIWPRHFVYLSSISIILTTLIASDIWKLLQNRPWIRFNWIITLIGLLMIQFLSSYIDILNNGIYLQ